jgi:hypothetical protein
MDWSRPLLLAKREPPGIEPWLGARIGKLRIYEINTRAHCANFNQITQAELIELSQIGFNAVWFMGVWQIGEGARKISKIISEDFEGSPFAISSYQFNPSLGGEEEFRALVERAHSAGLSVIVDFIPNHVALDSPWIEEDPEFFIRSDPRVRNQRVGDYFLHSSGEVIAFGRDPYFPPWYDTAQLDYTSANLRSRMIEVLSRISRLADGVRCDMAMLILRDYVRQQWYPRASDDWFNARMPTEFWGEAISQVKKARPDFIFIAEAYWDKEPQLLDLGFDLVYEKKLYDGLVQRNRPLIDERINRNIDALRRSVYFIENHDEARAASLFSREENLAAAALILSLPGSTLIHEGQMEGKREHLPVQLIKPRTNEVPDTALRADYEQLLILASDEVFQSGSFHRFDCGSPEVISFMRQDETKLIAYLGAVGGTPQPFAHTVLDISAIARAIGASSSVRVTNLLTLQSAVISGDWGRFLLVPTQIGAQENARFCLLAARRD